MFITRESLTTHGVRLHLANSIQEGIEGLDLGGR